MTIVTVEKLENADKDADSLEKFVEGGRTEVVKTRKNKQYPTLQNAVYQVIETGGFEPFATEVELLASTPILTKKAAKALDTKKVWLWDGKWNDTGLSELDLANDFTSKIFSRGVLSEGTNIKTVTEIGFFTLLSSSSYTGMPTEAVGKGCQLEVTNAVGGDAGYVIQKVTIHAESNKYWTRRVQKQPIAENNIAGDWFYSLDAINPSILNDQKKYAEDQAAKVLLKAMHSVTTDLANGSKLADQKQIGIYTLLSTNTYPDLPADFPASQGAVMEVIEVTDAIRLQRITLHAQANKVWSRRVTYSAQDETVNTVGEWFIFADINSAMIYKSDLLTDTVLKTVTGIGFYTLLSSSTYVGIPTDAVGKGCQLEVSIAVGGDAGYVIQKVTIHAESNKYWTRRVQKQPIAENNIAGDWFYSLDSQNSSSVPDFSKLPATERRLKNSEVWNDNSVVKVRSNWGDLYTQPTLNIIGDLTKLYAFYDALVAEFPNYITRETIGVDEWDLPIHQYTFSPPKRRMYEYSASVGKRPKILLTSGTHGGERGAQMGLIIFIDNLCRHWKELDIYNELRWNTDFVVIPATIPTSVQDAQRKNRNGVDCNRNFDWKWGEGQNPSQDPNHPMYQGLSAASEIDVQVLQREIPARHSDALLLLENHNHNNPQAFWIGSNTPSVMHIGLEAADKVTPYVFKEIVPNADQSKTTQFVTRNYEGSFAGYMESKGIPSILIETSGDLVFDQNDGTVTSLRRLHELLILNIVKATIDKEMRKRAENWTLV